MIVISATITDEAVLNSLCILKSIESRQDKNNNNNNTSNMYDGAESYYETNFFFWKKKISHKFALTSSCDLRLTGQGKKLT